MQPGHTRYRTRFLLAVCLHQHEGIKRSPLECEQ